MEKQTELTSTPFIRLVDTGAEHIIHLVSDFRFLSAVVYDKDEQFDLEDLYRVVDLLEQDVQAVRQYYTAVTSKGLEIVRQSRERTQTEPDEPDTPESGEGEAPEACD